MTSSDKPLPTQQIGNYRLSRLLGRGGMGAVYEAVHIGVGGRAAIKLLRAEVVDNPDITQRFFDEARAANSVEHPSIIKIFDSGQTDDGLCYLAMEYLDGETLAHRIKVLGQLSVTSAIRFARQAASALSAVHQRGLIHGACHTYVGQEAIATGVCAHLTPQDVVFSTHRGHGHALAKGMPPRELIAELLPFTWGAFILAVTSGALLFISKAPDYAGNFAFRITEIDYDPIRKRLASA